MRSRYHNRLKIGIAKSAVIGIIIVIIAIGAISAVLLFNHSARTPPPSNVTTTPTPTNQTVTITYFDDLSQSEAQVMQSVIIPQFEKQYPDIKINYVDEGRFRAPLRFLFVSIE